MIQNIPLEKILFLDIETVPQYENWEELDEKEKQRKSISRRFLPPTGRYNFRIWENSLYIRRYDREKRYLKIKKFLLRK